MDYAARKVEPPKLKAALTRASKIDRRAVVDAAHRAFARFDVIGWPDNWSHWMRAHNDALGFPSVCETCNNHDWSF